MPRVTSPQAKDRPAVRSKSAVDVAELPIGSPGARIQRASEDGPALDDPQIEIVDSVADPEKIANLAFMEEMVEVQVHTTSDKGAEQIFEIIVNGKRELFVRGETKTVARKFINVMANAREDKLEQIKERDAAGTLVFKNVFRSVMKYPFSIVNDPNPIGRAWISAVMRQAK